MFTILKQIHPTWIDQRSLIVFRIGIGIYLLYDIYSRTRYGRYDIAWYTSSNDGYLTQSDTPHNAPLHKLWFYRGTVTLQYTLFSITAILIWMVHIIGYNQWPIPTFLLSRQQQKKQQQQSIIRQIMDGIIKFIIFLLVTSYQNRNMLVHDGSDAFVRHLLFWICFLPLHYCDSYDNKNNHNQPKTTTTTRASTSNSVVVSGLPCFAILVQIVFMYLGTVCQRTIDRYPKTCFTWQYGILNCPESEWMLPSLSAVHYAMSGDFATRNNIVTQIIRTIPFVSKIMTFQAMTIEGFVPIICLLLVPYDKRHYPAFVLMLLHFGLYLSLRLPNWQFIGIITQVLWLPNTFWDTIMPLLYSSSTNNKNNNYTNSDYATIKKTDGDDMYQSNEYVITTQPASIQVRTVKSNILSKVLQFFWFCYMIYNFIGERYKPLLQYENGDIGEGLRLMQHWVMYGSVDHIAHNTFLTGTIVRTTYHHHSPDETNNTTNDDDSLQYIDIFQFVQTRNVTKSINRFYPDVTTNIINIQNVSDTFPSPRWERAIAGMASTSYQKRTQDRIRTFGTTVCKLINTDLQEKQHQEDAEEGYRVYYYLKEIEMRFQHLQLLPPGSKERYNLKNRAAPDTVVTIPCHQIPYNNYKINNNIDM